MTYSNPGTLESALAAFQDFVDMHGGIPPTARELATDLGSTSSSVGGRWMSHLLRAGYIADQFPGIESSWGDAGPSRRYALTELGRRAEVAA